MVGIVVVSHSRRSPPGHGALAAQMAGTTCASRRRRHARRRPGTDADRVRAAIDRADSGDGVVVLGDLGSAILTVRAVLAGRDERPRPAARRAARRGRRRRRGDRLRRGSASTTSNGRRGGLAVPPSSETTVALPPTSICTRAPRRSSCAPRWASARASPSAAGEREADAKSLLSVLSLGAKAGTTLRLRADGDDAPVAVGALAAAWPAYASSAATSEASAARSARLGEPAPRRAASSARTAARTAPDAGGADAQLAHAEPDQQRHQQRIAGRLAAHLDHAARLARRVAGARRSRPARAGRARRRAPAAKRSAPSTSAVRSFVPIERKSAAARDRRRGRHGGTRLDHRAERRRRRRSSARDGVDA